MNGRSRLFLLTGTDKAEPPARLLSAGPLSIELIDGNIGVVNFAGRDVLLSVAFLVRDRDWGTSAAVPVSLEVSEFADSFEVKSINQYLAPDGACLRVESRISGHGDGSLSFVSTFQPDRDFETARTGFVVLHPVVGVAGEKVLVEHGDGSIEDSHWPDLIEPWQPFKDIAAITHQVANGLSAETRFSGDVFEMEDQRNWTDASYKTYVRPLALPWPYLIQAGKLSSLGVSVRITGDLSAPAVPKRKEAIRLELVETDCKMAEIGLSLRPDAMADEQKHADLVLAASGAQHLICHFDPLAGHGPAALAHFADMAGRKSSKATLELALPCQRPVLDELQDIAEWVKTSGLRLDSLFVSPAIDRQSTPPGSVWPDCPAFDEIFSNARLAFPGVRTGGGMMSYFTELNRKRVPAGLVDYISHATNPIVHAADDRSVMQTLKALAYIARSVRAIYGDKPYRIGPSTIAMRQNPYGSTTKENPQGDRIPMACVDPRHKGLFGAAFAVGMAANLMRSGLEVLTLSALAGPFGLVAGQNEPAPEGAPRPLAHVIGWLSGFAGQNHIAAASSSPDAIAALGAIDNLGRRHLLIANITPQPQRLVMPGAVLEAGVMDAGGMGGGEGGFVACKGQIDFVLDAYGCMRLTIG